MNGQLGLRVQPVRDCMVFFSGCDAGMSCWHGVYSSLSHARYKVRVSGAFAQPHMELLHY